MDVVALATKYGMVSDMKASMTNPARVRATVRRMFERAANDMTLSPQERETWRAMEKSVRESPTPDMAIGIATHINRSTKAY